MATDHFRNEEELFELEDVFDEYRKGHLQPLSETTLELQRWLADYSSSYYIAQRLKRKPQIARKLRRLKVRLTQLQDIGGCRIIVAKNRDVDRLQIFIEEQVAKHGAFQVERITDYREKGRDDTGYRALHMILKRDGFSLELQIRSGVQHYWAEFIERTSVIYGYHLKESEGDPNVIQYFKRLSDAFYDIEGGRQLPSSAKLEIDGLRVNALKIIEQSERHQVLDSYVNEGIIKTLIEKEANIGKGLNNWIIVFDWNSGSFVSWDIVGRSPDDAIRAYVENEKNFPSEEGFEVVLIGSSEVSTVRRTHSHYFGIESQDSVLESLDASIAGFVRKIDLDISARHILLCLYRKHYWGTKAVSRETLKNHFCQNVFTFDESLMALIEKALVIDDGGLSLNLSMKKVVESYVSLS